jgi:hypothetical protein
MKHLAGLTLCVFGLAIPLAAHGQELHPCTPVAPGLRCAQPLSHPWGGLDFGAPRRVADALPDASRLGPMGREATILSPHGLSHGPSQDARRIPMTPAQAACATVARRSHQGPAWFAPALPQLPAVQPVQPIGHGHRISPALPVAPAASCR